jgi:hypothetical protein
MDTMDRDENWDLALRPGRVDECGWWCPGCSDRGILAGDAYTGWRCLNCGANW